MAPADVDNLRATVEGHRGAAADRSGARSLRLDGCTLLVLTESCQVAPAPPEELVEAGWFWLWPQSAALGPALRLTAPHAAQEWLLCTAIELSH